jgi:TetR/AcrR family transcriptional repressor of nem operon
MRPIGLYVCMVMSKGENTRQFIIEKAALIMNQKGVAGTSISDIMEATKLAKGGIYRRFENKEEICLEVFSYLSKRLYNKINVVIKDQATAKGKLFTMIDFYVDALVLSETGGCPMLNFGIEADDTDPIMRQRVGEAITASQARISRIIAHGITAGDFKASIDADSFSIKMFNLLEGTILASRVFNNKDQMNLVADILKKEIEAFSS